MTDSLTQLIQRIQGTIPVVQPLILSQFVPESAIATTNLFASVFHLDSLTADFPFSLEQSQSSISSGVSPSISPEASFSKTSENSNLLPAFTSESTFPASASLSVWWRSAPERSNSTPFQFSSSQTAFSQAEQSERSSPVTSALVSSEPEISERFSPTQNAVSDIVSAEASLAQTAFSEQSNSISCAISESSPQTSISMQTSSFIANQPIPEQSNSVSSNLISPEEVTASASHPSQLNPAIPKPLTPELELSESETFAPPQLLLSESLPSQQFISKESISVPSEQSPSVSDSIPSLQSSDDVVHSSDSPFEAKPIATPVPSSIHPASPSASFQASPLTNIQFSTEARSPQSSTVQPDLQTTTEPTSGESHTMVENSKQQDSKKSGQRDREDISVLRDRKLIQQTQHSTRLRTTTPQSATPQTVTPQTASQTITLQTATPLAPQTASQNSVEISQLSQSPVSQFVSLSTSSRPENHTKSDRPLPPTKIQPAIQSLAHLLSESDSNQPPEVAQPLAGPVIRPIARPVLPQQNQTDLASARPIGDRSEPGSRSSKIAPEPPTIQVTIGRIEVRKTEPAPAPSSRRTAQQKPALSLKDYLQQRNSGGSS